MAISVKRSQRVFMMTAAVLLCVYVAKVINFLNSPRYSREGSQSYTSSYHSFLNRPQQLPVSSSTDSFVNDFGCGKVVHIASIQLEPYSCQEFELLLKTIFFHRHHGIYIHVISRQITQKIIRRLLETWDLPHVAWTFTDVAELKVPLPSRESEAFLQKVLPYILPYNVTQVIYLSNRMRLLEDIYNLWMQFDLFSDDQAFGVLSETKTSAVADILLIKVNKMRNKILDQLESILQLHKKGSSIQDILKKMSAGSLYTIPCSWGVGLKQQFSKVCQPNSAVKALIWDPKEDVFSADENVELSKEKVLSVLSSDSAVYRNIPINCSAKHRKVSIDPKKLCMEYRYITSLKWRTHLYFIAPPELYESRQADKLDISLLTQFTLDRFHTFEHFMSLWEGPVQAVLYVTDAEALDLPARVAASKVLQKRRNIAYHLVYKRGRFYPINYLRNVAVKETQTPYLLFVDVDLVLNYGSYNKLKHYIGDHMVKKANVTLVVAAFESLVPLVDLPRNKSELLKLISQNKVVGYRMKRGWNLGHKPTNYPLWIKADKPYPAIWKDAYEPYTVLPTKVAPLYQEILLERMGDKIAYGRELYARGYEFWVLPDVFAIHLPHETSHGTNIWSTYRGYARCGAILFNEYRVLLKHQHPDKEF